MLGLKLNHVSKRGPRKSSSYNGQHCAYWWHCTIRARPSVDTMRKFRFDSINFLNQHTKDGQIKLRLVNSLVRSIFVMWLISVWHLDGLISCCAITILINIGSDNACCRTPHEPMVTYLYPCDGGVDIANQNQGLFFAAVVLYHQSTRVMGPVRAQRYVTIWAVISEAQRW